MNNRHIMPIHDAFGKCSGCGKVVGGFQSENLIATCPDCGEKIVLIPNIHKGPQESPFEKIH